DSLIKIWDIGNHSLLQELPAHSYGLYRSIALVENQPAPMLVSGNSAGVVEVWDLNQNSLLPLSRQASDWGQWIEAVAITEFNGRPALLSMDDSTIRAWDLKEMTPIGDPIEGHDKFVNALTVGEVEGRRMIVSGGDDGTVRVWDLVEALEARKMNEAVI